jgi:hypothetical protein
MGMPRIVSSLTGVKVSGGTPSRSSPSGGQVDAVPLRTFGRVLQLFAGARLKLTGGLLAGLGGDELVRADWIVKARRAIVATR